MKEGDLIRFHENPLMTAIITRGPFHKRVWGSSGHPEDIEIVSIYEIVRVGTGWKEAVRGKKKQMRGDYLRRIADVVSACKSESK